MESESAPDLTSVYRVTLRVMQAAFRTLEQRVPPPAFVTLGGYPAFRYTGKPVDAAIVQKCARLVSGLNASLVLLQHGYVQEIGVVLRTLDEFTEDIIFLCLAMDAGTKTKLHDDYLDDFYQEEFDVPEAPLLSTQKRKKIERKNIHAVLSRQPGQQVNQSDFQSVHRTITQANSGYVHASSTHVMDLYGGLPPHFHIDGMRGTPRMQEYERYLWDYFYRGLLSMMRAAMAFKAHELLAELYEFRGEIETATANTEWPDPEKLIKSLKRKQQ